MKKISIAALVAFSLVLAQTSVAESHRFIDTAKVKHVIPIYKTFEHRIPEETCWTESVRRERHHRASPTGMIIGSLIGAAIGHSAGHGRHNKKLGAVIGSAVGATIGNDIAHHKRHAKHRSHRDYEEVERCEVRYTTRTEERIAGYDVTYKYRGEVYTTHMHKHPGKRIKVKVSLSPILEY